MKSKLSLILAIMLIASCFTAGTAFAAEEIICNGTRVYEQNFEEEVALDKQAPMKTMFQYFAGMTKWAAVQPYSAIITKEATASDPEYIGNKYVLVGQTQSADLYSKNGQADFSGRMGNAFDKAVSSGIINIDFDAKVSKNPLTGVASGWSYFGLCDLEEFTTEDRIIGLCNANGAIGSGLNGEKGVCKDNIGLDTWGHISADYNLDTGELVISVNNGIPLVTKFDKTRQKYLGFYIMSTHNCDFAIDNIVVTEGGVSRYVGFENDFEEADELQYGTLAPISTAETVVTLETELVGTDSLDYGDKKIYNGLNDVGYLAWSVGHNKVYNTLVNGNGYKNGKLKLEFDVLLGKGGLAFATGSNNTGGLIGGRLGLVFQRNTNQIVYQNVDSGYTDFYNEALYSNYSSYTVEGTDEPMKFVSNRWNHIELLISPATGDCVLTVDGVRSNPINHKAFKEFTSLCYMYRVMGEAWATVYDKTAYLDNIKVTTLPDIDIQDVQTTKDKILITMKNDIGNVTVDDIKLSDGLVTDVDVSGNKILVDVSGLETDWRYNLTLADTLTYADGTSIINNSYIFDYTENEFSVIPAAIVNETLTAGEKIACVIDIDRNMTDNEFIIFAAAYDENGKLAFVASADETISRFDYGKKSVSLFIKVPSDYTGVIKEVKTFVWKENIVPYESAVETVN